MDWLSGHQWEAWLILCLAFAAAELLSLDLFFVMLAGGAAVAAIAAALGVPTLGSALLAFATAIGLLTLIRPNLMRKLHAGADLRTGVDALIGRRASVLREIRGTIPGRVKIGGEEWAAVSYDEEDRLVPGDVVEVVQISGATAYVLRIPTLGGATDADNHDQPRGE